MTTTPRVFDAEAWLNQLNPATMIVHDGTQLRAIGQALYAIEAAEAELEQAVGAALAAGDSWSAIAMVLNTSKQAAHRKFGPKSTGDKMRERERHLPSKSAGPARGVRVKRAAEAGSVIPRLN